MNILDLIKSKRAHAARFSSENGISGERSLLNLQASWVERPKGKEMKNLLAALKEVDGIEIKRTSFDFITAPEGVIIDFKDITALRNIVTSLVFIEVKSCNQEPVTRPDFKNFFFAITENEMHAAEVLGARHKVFFYNKRTDDVLETSVSEILSRASSKNWQLSITLGASKV